MDQKHPFKIYAKTGITELALGGGTAREIFYEFISGRAFSPSEYGEYHVYNTETKTYQEVSEFLTKNHPFVPKFYQMDPRTEELIPDGRILSDGMVILLADPNHRGRPEKMSAADWELDRVMERNRWCTISNVSIRGNLLTFVATYEDGTKRKRSESTDTPWLVHKDSIEHSIDRASERFKKICDLVDNAMLGAVAIKESDVGDGAKIFEKASMVEGTARQIIDLFR